MAEVGLPVGARRKLAQGLAARARAARKAAALAVAEGQTIAAVVQMQRDGERVAKQREEIRALQRAVERRGGAPEEIVCPITHEIMLDPVVAADGHSYERRAIEEWLSQTGRTTSPNTGAELEDRALKPNHSLRKTAQRFIDECRAMGRDPDSAFI